MCIEDIRLGREARSSMTAPQIELTSTLLVGADPHRVALIIDKPNANRLTVGIQNPAVDLVGFTLESGNHPLSLDVRNHGDIVTKAWYGIMTVAAERIGVIEVSLHRT